MCVEHGLDAPVFVWVSSLWVQVPGAWHPYLPHLSGHPMSLWSCLQLPLFYFAELGQAGWSTGGLFALAAFPAKWHTLTASEMQFNINVDIWTETNGPYSDADSLLLSRGTDNIALVLFIGNCPHYRKALISQGFSE